MTKHLVSNFATFQEKEDRSFPLILYFMFDSLKKRKKIVHSFIVNLDDGKFIDSID
jgi:hypothetical protein